MNQRPRSRFETRAAGDLRGRSKHGRWLKDGGRRKVDRPVLWFELVKASPAISTFSLDKNCPAHAESRHSRVSAFTVRSRPPT